MGVFQFNGVLVLYMESEERTWVLISRAVAGEISPQELEEMQSLFLLHPALRSEFEALEKIKISSGIATIDERKAMERGLEKFDNDLRTKSNFNDLSFFNYATIEPLPKNTGKKWMIAASIISVLAISALGFYFIKTGGISSEVSKQEVLYTQYGKRIHALLPDGSNVWLNSGSTISYSEKFNQQDKREVTLNGEAFFDVKHDVKHPFIVHAGKLSVVVLGTAFNVKAYSADSFVETTLIRGKVVIDNAAKPGANIVLYPNEKVIIQTGKAIANTGTTPEREQTSSKELMAFKYDKKAVVPEVSDGAIVETSWVSNRLIFKKENFTDLALQLERWYDVKIIFDNDKYQKTQFTGSFKDQDIKEVMKALKLIGSFHYTINDNLIHIW